MIFGDFYVYAVTEEKEDCHFDILRTLCFGGGAKWISRVLGNMIFVVCFCDEETIPRKKEAIKR